MTLILLCSAPLAPRATAAPRNLGPNKCTSCHDHEPQKAWAAKDKHSRALQQLEDKNASKYAGAIGLSDPYSLKGSCVECHATEFAGDANAGVSCETCHGAGSDYLEPHQVKGSYSKAVALGMTDTRGNYPRWARLCVGCHIVTDRKLTAAGHPSGVAFEVSGESQKIKHWNESYDFAKLAAAGRAESARKGGGAAAQPAPVPKVTPTPAPTKEPKATRTPAPTKEPRATPTPAPATREPRATPTAVSPARPDAAPSPTTRPTLRESPTPKVMAPVTPTVTPPTEPAARPETQPAPSAPTAAPAVPTAAPSPSDIVIVIQATPISTVSPQVGARPTEVPTAVQTAPPEAEPRPSPTRHPTIRKKPRPVRPGPRATVSIRKEPSPPAVSKALPTPTRTRVPAPRRTLRAPH